MTILPIPPDIAECPDPYQRAPRVPQTQGIVRDRLLLAPPSLQGAIVSIISRDAREIALTPAQRLSHFPSSPLVSLSWFRDIDLGLFDVYEGRPRWRPFGASVLVSGSQSSSTVSWAPKAGRARMMSFTADVARVLLKLDVAAVQDRFVPAHEVLDREYWPFLNALLEAADDPLDDAATMKVIEEYLAPLWQAVQARPTSAPSLQQVGRHWVERLARQAHGWRGTLSLRQVERRIKAQSGRSIREWQSLIKTESVFFSSREKIELGESINLTELALDEGFSDQAHLSRATKRVTGFSPTEFAQRYVDDESFWLYRLWV
jgi:AraC-like DNA-binding protein